MASGADSVLFSTIKLSVRKGKFECDTSYGHFSIYLPLPDNQLLQPDKTGYPRTTSDILEFIKVSNDNNQITIWGSFMNNTDCVVFGRGLTKLRLKCKDGYWQCA